MCPRAVRVPTTETGKKDSRSSLIGSASTPAWGGEIHGVRDPPNEHSIAPVPCQVVDRIFAPGFRLGSGVISAKTPIRQSL